MGTTASTAHRRLGASDCEAVHPSGLAQPVAAMTSLAFVGGAVVLWQRRGARGHHGWVANAGYPATLALTGLGSWWYHGPQGRWARVLHDGSIALMVTEAVTVPVVRVARGRAPIPPGGRRQAAVAGGLMAGAALAYVLGRTGSPLCRPDSLIQWHGAWHVLAAAAFTAWGAALWPTTPART